MPITQKHVLIFIEAVLLPIFGLVSYILNTISTFKNVNSFTNRPKYIYGFADADDMSDYSDFRTNQNCTTPITEELADFVNNINTGYTVFMFILYFIVCTLGLIAGTIIKIARHVSKNPNSIVKFKKSESYLDYSAFVFAVPSCYCNKIYFGDCLEVDGVVQSMIGDGLFITITLGMWFLITLVIYYFLRGPLRLQRYEEGIVKMILIVMWIYAFMFLVFGLIIKFGSIFSLQVGWDVYLSFDLAHGIIVLKFFDWNVAKVTPINNY